MKKKIWHDIKLMAITMLALIACPTAFYLAIVAEHYVYTVIYLAICILCGAWLFLFELANGRLKGE